MPALRSHLEHTAEHGRAAVCPTGSLSFLRGLQVQGPTSGARERSIPEGAHCARNGGRRHTAPGRSIAHVLRPFHVGVPPQTFAGGTEEGILVRQPLEVLASPDARVLVAEAGGRNKRRDAGVLQVEVVERGSILGPTERVMPRTLGRQPLAVALVKEPPVVGLPLQFTSMACLTSRQVALSHLAFVSGKGGKNLLLLPLGHVEEVERSS